VVLAGGLFLVVAGAVLLVWALVEAAFAETALPDVALLELVFCVPASLVCASTAVAEDKAIVMTATRRKEVYQNPEPEFTILRSGSVDRIF